MGVRAAACSRKPIRAARKRSPIKPNTGARVKNIDMRKPQDGCAVMCPQPHRKKAQSPSGMLDARGAHAELEVDGGVKADNVAEVVRRGARVIVAGSAIFVGGGGIQANTVAIRAEIARASH